MSHPSTPQSHEISTKTRPQTGARRRSISSPVDNSDSEIPSFSQINNRNNSFTPPPLSAITKTSSVPSHQRQSSVTFVNQPREEELVGDSLEMNSLNSMDSDEEAGLTSASRERQRLKKGRRRGMSGLTTEDGRILRDAYATGASTDSPRDEDQIINGIAVSKAERKLADIHVVKSMLINGVLIGLWYCFSLMISVYNKWMFSKEPNLNFPFPLFVTSIHMIVQFCLASLVLYLVPHLRPGYSVSRPRKGGRSSPSSPSSPSAPNKPNNYDEDETLLEDDGSLNQVKKPLMTKRFYLTRITPCGLATGLDIGLGNMSLKFITLAFYTMCKSSSLAFVLIFAFIFHLEKPTLKLVSIITIMTAGVVMMVFGEVKFVWQGFALVMTASMLSGLRWSLTQLLLLRNPATGNPFSSIFFLAPVMFVGLLGTALSVEGFGHFSDGFNTLADKKGVFVSLGLIVFPGFVAFCMTASEFALLQRTSVVTLSICGIFKEVLTISVSATVFDDKLTPINISGLFVTIISIAGYNYIKIRQMRGEAVRDVITQEVSGSDDEEEVRRSVLFERMSWVGTPGLGTAGGMGFGNLRNSLNPFRDSGRIDSVAEAGEDGRERGRERERFNSEASGRGT